MAGAKAAHLEYAEAGEQVQLEAPRLSCRGTLVFMDRSGVQIRPYDALLGVGEQS